MAVDAIDPIRPWIRVSRPIGVSRFGYPPVQPMTLGSPLESSVRSLPMTFET